MDVQNDKGLAITYKDGSGKKETKVIPMKEALQYSRSTAWDAAKGWVAKNVPGGKLISVGSAVMNSFQNGRARAEQELGQKFENAGVRVENRRKLTARNTTGDIYRVFEDGKSVALTGPLTKEQAAKWIKDNE